MNSTVTACDIFGYRDILFGCISPLLGLGDLSAMAQTCKSLRDTLESRFGESHFTLLRHCFAKYENDYGRSLKKSVREGNLCCIRYYLHLMTRETVLGPLNSRRPPLSASTRLHKIFVVSLRLAILSAVDLHRRGDDGDIILNMLLNFYRQLHLMRLNGDDELIIQCILRAAASNNYELAKTMATDPAWWGLDPGEKIILSPDQRAEIDHCSITNSGVSIFSRYSADGAILSIVCGTNTDAFDKALATVLKNDPQTGSKLVPDLIISAISGWNLDMVKHVFSRVIDECDENEYYRIDDQISFLSKKKRRKANKNKKFAYRQKSHFELGRAISKCVYWVRFQLGQREMGMTEFIDRIGIEPTRKRQRGFFLRTADE